MSYLAYHSSYAPDAVGDKAERIKKRKKDDWNKFLDEFLAIYAWKAVGKIEPDTLEDFWTSGEI